jgi:hypothetical protein
MMDTTKDVDRTGTLPSAIFLRTCVVLLTLTTAAVHAWLGGPLFTANAVGYTVLAVAMLVPGPLGRFRWLARLALIGFAAATIGGWVLFGARFPLAYLDKGVEVALIVFLAIELWLFDGGPAGIARRLRALVGGLVETFLAKGAR